MAYLNNCAFIGVTGSDPTVRTFESGNKVANLNIAVTKRFRDRNGEQKELTEWIPLVFSGNQADFAEKYITKGIHLYVSGELHTRTYTNRDNVECKITEIVVREVQILSKKDQNNSPKAADDDLPI